MGSAAYNFVPLSGHVVTVPWGAAATHDVPFEDGISGTLRVRIQTTTPVCVGGRREKNANGPTRVHPFRLEERYALPGSSVRGMLRNVLEIATFSRMSYVDRARRFAIRDLTSAGEKPYRSKMTETVLQNGYKAYRPWVRAGRLRNGPGAWEIEECEVARVEQRDLLCLLDGRDPGDAEWGAAAEEMRRLFCPDDRSDRPDLVRKTETWIKLHGTNEISFRAGPLTSHNMSGQPNRLVFRLATELGRGPTRGRLVFTGQPGPNCRLVRDPADWANKGKHREFAFFDAAGPKTTLIVPDPVRRDFERLNGVGSGERKQGVDDPTPEWKYWKRRLSDGDWVPVFFLADGPKVLSLGLAQMYRLPYDLSVGDCIDAASVQHDPEVEDGSQDFAETLFGFVRGRVRGGTALRGRVSVGTFLAAPGSAELGPFRATLGAPKASYVPTYLKQPTAADRPDRLAQGASYTTYMATTGVHPEVRGWKRYPSHPPPANLPIGEEQRLATEWKAVRGAFEGTIYVHNIRPEELGALLWTIGLGEDATKAEGRARVHGLGFAKPFGFGAVQLTVTHSDLSWVDPERPGAPELPSCTDAFCRFMESAVPDGWSSTEQVAQLLAMADPARAAAGALTSMVLDRRDNQFKKAKDERWVLRPYAKFDGKTDVQRFPRRSPDVQRRGREEAAERRRRAAEAALEARRIARLAPEDRVRAVLAGIESASPTRQRELLGQALAARMDERDPDPPAFRQALGRLAGGALDQLRAIASGADSPELVRARERLATLQRARPPGDRRDRPVQRWKDECEKVQKQIEQLERQAANAATGRAEAARVVAWLSPPT